MQGVKKRLSIFLLVAFLISIISNYLPTNAITSYATTNNIIKASNGTYCNRTYRGNLIIYGSNVTLKSVKISGKLTIASGKTGTTSLNNVTASSIEVKSAGSKGIYLNNVTASSFVVNASSSNVLVRAVGSTKINSTLVSSNATLNCSSDLFGNIVLSNSSNKSFTAQMQGKYSKSISAQTSVTLKSLNAAIENVKVEPKISSSVITFDGPFKTLDIKKTCNLTFKGTSVVGKVNASSNSNITVNKGASIKEFNNFNKYTIKLMGDGANSVNVLHDYATLKDINEVNVQAGLSQDITVGAFPSDANITAISDNTNVVSCYVNNGIIKVNGLNVGRAGISITAAKDGYAAVSKKFYVNVTATNTAAGSLNVTSANPIAKADNQIVKIVYTLGEAFKNGSVRFTLPSGFTASLNDSYYIDNGTSTALGISSISGSYVTINGINASAGQKLTLALVNKTLPSTGNYNFTAVGDADGDGNGKLLSAGTGNETVSFTIKPGNTVAGTLSVSAVSSSSYYNYSTSGYTTQTINGQLAYYINGSYYANINSQWYIYSNSTWVLISYNPLTYATSTTSGYTTQTINGQLAYYINGSYYAYINSQWYIYSNSTWVLISYNPLTYATSTTSGYTTQTINGQLAYYINGSYYANINSQWYIYSNGTWVLISYNPLTYATSTASGYSAQNITLTYTLGESYTNGTVQFTLPSGITAATTDTVTIASGSTQQISTSAISGQVLTVSGITASSGSKVVVVLNNKYTYLSGSTSFSAIGDADGSGPKQPTSGTGNETASVTISTTATTSGTLTASYYTNAYGSSTTTLNYVLGETYTNGSVQFTLPSGLTPSTSDQYMINNVVQGFVSSSSISGQTVTLNSINATSGQTVSLVLVNKGYLASGTFKAVGDSDGANYGTKGYSIGSTSETTTYSGSTGNATTAGTLTLSPTTISSNTTATITATYFLGETYKYGKVVLTFPSGITVGAGDYVSIGGNTVALSTVTSGNTIILTNINLAQGQPIIFTFASKPIYTYYTYPFTVSGDCDGDSGVRTATSGNSSETKYLTAYGNSYNGYITASAYNTTAHITTTNGNINSGAYWTLSITGGTLKDSLTSSDIILTGLPSGVSYYITKTTYNSTTTIGTVNIYITGSASAMTVGTLYPIYATVSPSAVGLSGISGSAPVTLQLYRQN